MPQLLWRVEGEPAAPNLDRWQQGLTLHLLFQPLTTIIVRREGQTRHYLALAGCPSCRPDSCDRLCHRTLFAQLVSTTLPGVALIPVIRLTSRASERRQLIAVPHRAEARLLDAAFLSQWSEGRLVTTWSRLQAKPRPITVGAQLAVVSEGPAPASALQAAGWRGVPIASVISGRARPTDIPPPVSVGARASEALFAALRDPLCLTGAAVDPRAEPASVEAS
ncbi:MAG: hypothetical protein HGA45_01875 [Chloroflexales bacterium]|nr:hypothetical protein [Chloroflexales bacterium]